MNLNEIMEEYAKNKEEAIQEVQSRVEQETKKTRKRKRGVEEVGTEQRRGGGGGGGGGGGVSDIISKRAYFAWRDKLQHKDFIGERGSTS